MQNPTPGAHYVLLPPPHSSGRTPWERFREWRAETLPHAHYQLEQRFWTPGGLRRYRHLDPALRRGSKYREPTVTGLAYDAETVYLVIAAAKPSHGHAAKLTQCRRLMRRDHDWDAHQGKRIVLVLLCDECPPNVAEFARASRIQIVTAAPTPAIHFTADFTAALKAKVQPNRLEGKKVAVCVEESLVAARRLELRTLRI